MENQTADLQAKNVSQWFRYLPYVAAYVTGGVAVGVAGYFTYRWFRPAGPLVAPHIENNLPLAKNLKTIHDSEGNYDIDGVSFDSEGVIVSGDENIPAPNRFGNPHIL